MSLGLYFEIVWHAPHKASRSAPSTSILISVASFPSSILSTDLLSIYLVPILANDDCLPDLDEKGSCVSMHHAALLYA